MNAPVEVGTVLASKYRVERILGVGGMGVVVAATHIALEQRVAVKFMLPEMLSNADAVARFLREARAAVRLRGEHVGRVLDVGKLDNGAPYMVMEFLEGKDLAALLVERGRFSVEEAVEHVLQACLGMAEAHDQSIIHRDLKPQNLFLTHYPDGSACLKVIDFGISKADFASTNFHATHTSAIMGSPSYMSPEQMRSAKDVDVRADIWALGVILYQLVTGKTPFVADALPALIIKVMQEEPTPASVLYPDLPKELDVVIACCLAKERTQRYANIVELVSGLAPFAPTLGAETLRRVSKLLKTPVAARTTTPLSQAVRPVSASDSNTLGDAAGEIKATVERRPRRRAVLVTLGLAVVAVVVFLLLPRSRNERGSLSVPAATPQAPPAVLADAAPPRPMAVTPSAPVPMPDAAVAVGSAAPPPPPPAAQSHSGRARKPAGSVTRTESAPAKVRAPAPAPVVVSTPQVETASPQTSPANTEPDKKKSLFRTRH
jgi:serine/threonine-protein kinase